MYLVDDELSEIGGSKVNIQQTIEYCFRPLSRSRIESILTFNVMKEEGITSEDLIQWSSPIDIIERYENYLQMNNSLFNDQYLKCIDGWFGESCEYSFDLNLAPFSINLLSAIGIIGLIARQHSILQNNETFWCHFKTQIQTHKHLLISPTCLVILCLPRLIISFHLYLFFSYLFSRRKNFEQNVLQKHDENGHRSNR